VTILFYEISCQRSPQEEAVMFEQYRDLEPTEAEIAQVLRRARSSLRRRERLRHRIAAATAVATACLVAVAATPGGRAALADGVAHVESLDAFVRGGSPPGARATGRVNRRFLADFAGARAGTVRILAKTPDGEELAAMRVRRNGRVTTCFDYGHHYVDCGMSNVFERGPFALLFATKSHTPGKGAIWALVPDEVATVELRYVDGGIQRQHVHDGVAMLFDLNRRPSELVAFSARGRVIGKQAKELRLQTAPWLIDSP
jgi:hypothetical protein